VAGERLVADQLGRALGDEWTLLRGYRNRRGEIDFLLLGPLGLFAMEVKNQNATIDCVGDRWQATKYDKYGNLVGGRAEMTDTRGRSPSEQLNEPASELEGFLGRFGHPVTISRIVVLTHPRARLRSRTSPTVHFATSIRQITDLLNGSPVAITTAERCPASSPGRRAASRAPGSTRPVSPPSSGRSSRPRTISALPRHR
jgi:hypothetical protein